MKSTFILLICLKSPALLYFLHNSQYGHLFIIKLDVDRGPDSRQAMETQPNEQSETELVSRNLKMSSCSSCRLRLPVQHSRHPSEERGRSCDDVHLELRLRSRRGEQRLYGETQPHAACQIWNQWVQTGFIIIIFRYVLYICIHWLIDWLKCQIDFLHRFFPTICFFCKYVCHLFSQ